MPEKLWTVGFDPAAIDDLKDLDPQVRERIRDKLHWLADNLPDARLERLTANLAGYWKLRAGDWRAVVSRYEDRTLVVIHAVGHRSEIYKIAAKRLK